MELNNDDSNFTDSPSSKKTYLYRYPGFRPFQDNDIDRKLFFGRKNEKESILNKIFAEKLVLLYAKSGMGKTSLLNAGVLEKLRKKEFVPLVVRLHEPEKSFWSSFYESVEDEINKNEKAGTIAEYIPGEKNTLWEFFKTAEFWSPEDILLSPILILDQFEEIFTLHNSDDRKDFFDQMADIVIGRPPKALTEHLEPGGSLFKKTIDYSERKPNIKIVVAIRETFLGSLEELAEDIPAIFKNRLKLEPLNRKNAEEAIVGPSKEIFQDETRDTTPINYNPEAVSSILDFLCGSANNDQPVGTESVEPFQLQLICSHIETKIQLRSNKEVRIDDLGGVEGMQQIMQEFYDIEMQSLPSEYQKFKTDIRNLFENGFISKNNRRLPLHADDIKDRFGISENVLRYLIHRRLLRSEPKNGSFLYELSHDTLIIPIRESQKKRLAKETELEQKRKLEEVEREKERIANEAKAALEKERAEREKELSRERAEREKELAKARAEKAEREKELAKARAEKAEREKELEKERAEKAEQEKELIRERTTRLKFTYLTTMAVVIIFVFALSITIYSYYKVNKYWELLDEGNKSLVAKKHEDASLKFNEAISFKKDHSAVYQYLGIVYDKLHKYDKAIEFFKKGIECDDRSHKLFVYLGDAYLKAKNELEAIKQYKKAIDMAPYAIEEKVINYVINNIVSKPDQGKDEINNYKYAIKLAASKVDLNIYDFVIEKLQSDGNEKEAEFYKKEKDKVIKNTPDEYTQLTTIGYRLLSTGEIKAAIVIFEKAFEIAPQKDNFNDYITIGNALFSQNDGMKAIKYYEKAIKMAPDMVDANVYSALGDMLMNQGNEEEAIKNYINAFKAHGKDEVDSNICLKVGFALINQGREKEAIEYYEKAIKKDPDKVNYNDYIIVGNALLKQGKEDEAIKYYMDAFNYAKKNSIKDTNFSFDKFCNTFRKKVDERLRKLNKNENEVKEFFKKVGC